MFRDILRKIPAAVMLVCDVLLTLVLYDLFYIFIPEIKSNRIINAKSRFPYI